VAASVARLATATGPEILRGDSRRCVVGLDSRLRRLQRHSAVVHRRGHQWNLGAAVGPDRRPAYLRSARDGRRRQSAASQLAGLGNLQHDDCGSMWTRDWRLGLASFPAGMVGLSLLRWSWLLTRE